MSRRDIYAKLFDSVLSDSDFERAIELKDAKRITEQVIIPRMSLIDEITDQANNPRFMAYALIFTLEL